jgi:hypothetical protein
MEQQTLTKQQRHEIYIRAKHLFMYKSLIELTFKGMCGSIIGIARSSPKFFRIIKTRHAVFYTDKVFPDLYEIKPEGKGFDEYWWPLQDTETRIKMFDILIQMTDEKTIDDCPPPVIDGNGTSTN